MTDQTDAHLGWQRDCPKCAATVAACEEHTVGGFNDGKLTHPELVDA